MKTLSLNKECLKEFIDSEEYSSLKNLPISRIRALSHIANPRANEDDILLVAIIDSNKTIGYLGALPDDCVDANGMTTHFAWLSCFWVDKNYREKNIAAELFMVMMQAWSSRLAITNIVPSLENVYGKMKMFAPIRKISGTRYYFRLNLATILPPKHKAFQISKPILSAFDFIFNGICGIFKHSVVKASMQAKSCLATGWDNQAAEFIRNNPTDSITRRGAEELDWILNYPWIKSSGDEKEAGKYFFSSLDSTFSQCVIKVIENGCIVAVMLANIRKNCVTVPYLFVDSLNQNASRTAAEALLNYCKSNKVDMLTVFNKNLQRELDALPKNTIHQKEVTRPYFLGKKVTPLLSEKVWFQDGDGDCVFC